jgi:hypothetical protein
VEGKRNVVKDLSKSGSKFATNAGNAAGFYKDGVQGAGAKWKPASKTARRRTTQGVQNAISRGAFKKGVSEGRRRLLHVARGQARRRAIRARRPGGRGQLAGGFKPYADALKRLVAVAEGPEG